MHKITRILINAARTGNVRIAARLIDTHGLSFRPEWLQGYKFFKIAVKNKKPEFVKFLISRGCLARKNNKTFKNAPLHFAVSNKNIEIVELLLRQGANVNSKNKMGDPPLAVAVFRGCLKIVDLLIDYGADVNVKVKDLLTPLHIACKGNFGEIAELLLKRGAEVNAITIHEETPLQFAVLYANRDVVKFLLEHGANLHDLNQKGNTALFLAVRRGYLPVVEEILKYPDCVCESNETCLEVALRKDGKDFEKIVVALLDYGFTVLPESASKPEVLCGAVEKGNLKVVECLLEYGADVNILCSSQEDLLSPLHIAVKNKDEEMTQLLIRYKADLNATDREGRPPIFYAVDNLDLGMTQLLLSNEANVKDFAEVFHAAVRRNSVEIAEALLPHGVDVNVDGFGKTAPYSVEENDDSSDIEESSDLGQQHIMDKYAQYKAKVKSLFTPLHVSIEKGYDSMVNFLLKHDVNVNAADKIGDTPLHLAAKRGRLDICTQLLSRGARVNARNGYGDSALNLAVRVDHGVMVKLLMESGSQVNYKGYGGKAPLHWAADNRNPGIIDALLRSGANVDSRCSDGKTPLHYSCKRGDANIVKTLLDYGADMRITCEYTESTPLDVASREAEYYIPSDADDYDDDEDDIDNNRFDDTVAVLHRHKVKLETAGYEEWEELYMRDDLELPVDFVSHCESELAKMASELIDGTNVSYRDIAVKDTRFQARYVNNENIVKAIEREDYKEKFPLYAGVIKGQFRKGLRRKKFLEPAAQVFRSFVDLPEECSEKILEYFNESDLKTLVRLRRLMPLRA